MLTSCPVHAFFKKRKPAHPLPFAVIDTIHHCWSCQYRKQLQISQNLSTNYIIYQFGGFTIATIRKNSEKILLRKPGIKIKNAFPIHLLSLKTIPWTFFKETTQKKTCYTICTLYIDQLTFQQHRDIKGIFYKWVTDDSNWAPYSYSYEHFKPTHLSSVEYRVLYSLYFFYLFMSTALL